MASSLPGDGAAPSLHKAALGASAASPGPVRLASARGSVHPHPFPCLLPPAVQFQLEARCALSHGSVPSGRHRVLAAPEPRGHRPAASPTSASEV